jgi:hypothetical protein
MPAMVQGSSDLQESFERYKNRLHSQVSARTPLLDEVLSPLESRARRLKHDLDYMDVSVDEIS